FLQMREAEELTDVTLVFGDRRLPCHKVILAGMCEYFHRMFLTDMMECYSKEIVMKDINASTGVLLVDYFYTQKIDITTNNAQDLLEASDMLLIDTLKHNVEEFLCNQADKSNCISLLNLAQFYDLKLLLKETESILHDLQVNDLIDTEEVHLLSEKHLHVYVIGGNDGQSVLKSVDALDMWTLEWSSLPHMPQPLQCPYVVFVSNKLFVLGGLHGCMDPMEWSEDVYEYDSTSKTWHKRTPMPEQCPDGAAVALGDQIYVVGGSNRSCMEYNPHMDSWLHLQ
ncbi:hypothetical protein CAPTEDRAFT_53735, partial [Capitella teleta]